MLVPVVPIGNSRGIRFPKVVLDRLLVKDKMEMEVTEKGVLLTPVESPRAGAGRSRLQKCMRARKTRFATFPHRRSSTGKNHLERDSCGKTGHKRNAGGLEGGSR